jgi:hypothetical protein
MAPHLSEKELDDIQKWKDLPTSDIMERLGRARGRRGVEVPGLRVVQRALKGDTFRRGVVEKRGRKKKLSTKNVKKMNTVRKTLIKEAKGEREVHWGDILKKARVPKAHRTTVSRAFQRAGIPVAARKPREKPMRKPEHNHSRVAICSKWARRPAVYFSDSIDLIMDNKQWEIPTTATGKRYQNMKRVRFHLRTKSEGLAAGFTKPSVKKNRVNTGARVSVCAGIIGCKVKLWHYLPKKNWCGKVAEELYRGPVMNALTRHAGPKPRYTVMEDNDPTGYKSNRAKTARAELKIRTIDFPRYSPDLNPMDFFMWSEVQRRMDKGKIPKKESVSQYKTRLRRTAMAIPEAVIRKAVMSIKTRAKAVVEAKGGDIAAD